jgi:hypothetical protein
MGGYAVSVGDSLTPGWHDETSITKDYFYINFNH